ncbi:MAG TPA: phosphoribosylformylglycinamidine synthase subunit PurQ [Dehalococcoidia bacterium]|nr:phosphoribosylformylglycinamidine synthase subunit PurQ [Dehalococcoidia bacterium]
MRFAVVVFPGTWSDHDSQYALRDVMGHPADLVWHRQSDLSSYDAIVLPGGFSYGDYLRTGAIARFSPVMQAVVRDAEAGKPVIGICNGFQILCEAHLLPGALMRNEHLQYRCEWLHLLTQNTASAWTRACEPGGVLRIPISHGEGRYFADDATLDELERTGRVAFRYCTADGEVTADANPNGSVRNIAGIVNERGNVLGMMPHPERAVEALMGGEDGLAIWSSVLEWAAVKA